MGVTYCTVFYRVVAQCLLYFETLYNFYFYSIRFIHFLLILKFITRILKKLIGWLWVGWGRKMWKQEQFEDGGDNPASIAIGGYGYLLKCLLMDKV